MTSVDPRDEPAGVEAARRVLVEVWTVLSEHRESLTLVGGSAPPFLVHEATAASYVGTLDVDVVVDPVDIPADAYRSIAEQLETHGYYNEPKQQPFRWYREVDVDGRSSLSALTCWPLRPTALDHPTATK